MGSGRIEEWSTYRSAFQAPELPPSIQGKLGDRHVITSPVVRAVGTRVWTESGSEYELGEPDPKWLQWLASNDYQFDPLNPIKTVKKLSNLKPPAEAGSSSGRPFPVMMTSEGRKRLRAGELRGYPEHVPWWLVEPHAEQAMTNHGQTLERLAERGGLDPTELVAVLEDRRWEAMPLEGAVARLRVLLSAACPLTDDDEAADSQSAERPGKPEGGAT